MAETEARDSVGYVLKGYPRISELFIASEIWRLEQLGLPLRLFVLKPADETEHHPVVDRIEATPSYLPETTSLSGVGVRQWLRENFGSFRPALGRVARRHPLRTLRAAAAAAGQAVRARDGLRPRSIYLKEFLQAADVADRLLRAQDVRHLHAHFAHGTTTVTWLASMLTKLPFSFTGHAKDIYRESLNPAGLLRRKMRAASFVVTCTGANQEHLRKVEPTADVHLVYHGLNADFAALLPTAPVRPDPTPAGATAAVRGRRRCPPNRCRRSGPGSGPRPRPAPRRSPPTRTSPRCGSSRSAGWCRRRASTCWSRPSPT